MAEQEQKKRGRPRKQPEQTPTTSAPEATVTTPEIDTDEIILNATHNFAIALHRAQATGSELELAYIEAQDALTSLPDTMIGYRMMMVITGLGQMAGTLRDDQEMVTKYGARRNTFKTVLQRSQSPATTTPNAPIAQNMTKGKGTPKG